MKLKKIFSGKLIVILFLASIMVITVIGLSIQLNWYQVANQTGTIPESGVTITKANLDLGNLNSGSIFEVTDTLTISIPANERGGLNITKAFLIFPVEDNYLQDRFATLIYNYTISGMQYQFKIRESGISSGGFPYNGFEGSYRWYGRSVANVFLATGTHNILLTSYGLTTSPNTTLTIDLGFGFELT